MYKQQETNIWDPGEVNNKKDDKGVKLEGLDPDTRLLIESLQQQISLLRKQLMNTIAAESGIDSTITLKDAKENLKQAMERLMAGEASAQEDYDKWDKLLSEHPDRIAELAQKEAEWEEREKYNNLMALREMLGFVPPDIGNSSIESLTDRRLPLVLAKRIFTKKALWLLRMDTTKIAKYHLVDLRVKFSTQGLDIIELRAVYSKLPVIFENDPKDEKLKIRNDIRAKLVTMVEKERENKLDGTSQRNRAYFSTIKDDAGNMKTKPLAPFFNTDIPEVEYTEKELNDIANQKHPAPQSKKNKVFQAYQFIKQKIELSAQAQQNQRNVNTSKNNTNAIASGRPKKNNPLSKALAASLAQRLGTIPQRNLKPPISGIPPRSSISNPSTNKMATQMKSPQAHSPNNKPQLNPSTNKPILQLGNSQAFKKAQQSIERNFSTSSKVKKSVTPGKLSIPKKLVHTIEKVHSNETHSMGDGHAKIPKNSQRVVAKELDRLRNDVKNTELLLKQLNQANAIPPQTITSSKENKTPDEGWIDVETTNAKSSNEGESSMKKNLHPEMANAKHLITRLESMVQRLSGGLLPVVTTKQKSVESLKRISKQDTTLENMAEAEDMLNRSSLTHDKQASTTQGNTIEVPTLGNKTRNVDISPVSSPITGAAPECIVNHKVVCLEGDHSRKVEFLIRWKGETESNDQWTSEKKMRQQYPNLVSKYATSLLNSSMSTLVSHFRDEKSKELSTLQNRLEEYLYPSMETMNMFWIRECDVPKRLYDQLQAKLNTQQTMLEKASVVSSPGGFSLVSHKSFFNGSQRGSELDDGFSYLSQSSKERGTSVGSEWQLIGNESVTSRDLEVDVKDDTKWKIDQRQRQLKLSSVIRPLLVGQKVFLLSTVGILEELVIWMDRKLKRIGFGKKVGVLSKEIRIVDVLKVLKGPQTVLLKELAAEANDKIFDNRCFALIGRTDSFSVLCTTPQQCQELVVAILTVVQGLRKFT